MARRGDTILPFRISGASNKKALDGVSVLAENPSGSELDCCELEAHILYSATMLPTETMDESPRAGPVLDFSSLESQLAQLACAPADECTHGSSYRVLGAELERELDQCLDERASLLAAFDGRDAESLGAALSPGFVETSTLQSYVIESILGADDALSYDPDTGSFYRITLNAELGSDQQAPLLGNQLHQVPSVYESMLLGFLTAAILSQRATDPESADDDEEHIEASLDLGSPEQCSIVTRHEQRI